MKQWPTYSVAIRTLGKAGDKYLTTLQTCAAQTHKPEKIMVYLAEGFDKPKETIGIEQVVYVKKGMIAQRALRYDEIDSEFILCLDDDMELSPDSVERLFAGIQEYDGDCITHGVSGHHRKSVFQMAILALGGVYPHWYKNWGVRIKCNSYFSYNHHPVKDVLPTQSLHGTMVLVRKSAMLAVHFEEEEWMDAYGYPLGEDQMLGNKLYKNGYKVLVHYNSGIKHLDAGTSHKRPSWECEKFLGELRYLLMYRSCYDLKRNTTSDKLWCKLTFMLQFIPSTFYCLLRVVKSRSINPLGYLQGIVLGGGKVKIFGDLKKFDDHQRNS